MLDLSSARVVEKGKLLAISGQKQQTLCVKDHKGTAFYTFDKSLKQAMSILKTPITIDKKDHKEKLQR